VNKTKNLIEYWTKYPHKVLNHLLEKSYLDGEYEIGTEYDGTYDDSGLVESTMRETMTKIKKIIYSKYLKIKNNYHMVQLVL
jgi:hypothetical protein